MSSLALFLMVIFLVRCVGLSYPAKEPTKPDPNWITESIDRHNVFRKGYDAPPLVLNTELCAWSQLAASRLAAGDLDVLNEFTADSPYGLNLYIASFGDREIYGSTPVDAWYDEIRDFDFRSLTSYIDQRSDRFTQVVWKSTREMCISHCTSTKTGKDFALTVYVVAVYYPSGNTEDAYSENITPLLKSLFWYEGSWAAPVPTHLSKAIGIVSRELRGNSSHAADEAQLRGRRATHTAYDQSRRLEDLPYESYFTLEKPHSDILCGEQGGIMITITTRPEWMIKSMARMNHYRYKHGAHMLVLNRELCEMSQSWTNWMAKWDTFLASGSECGEMIYVHQHTGPATGEFILAPEAAVDSWYKQVTNYQVSNISIKKDTFVYDSALDPETAGTVDNFTQLVWESSLETCVTMATTTDKARSYVQALYYPKGNVMEMYRGNVRMDRTWIEKHDAGGPPLRSLNLITICMGVIIDLIFYYVPTVREQ